MKIGDKVRFISEVGGGVVSGFQGKNIVLVQDEDGFDIPMAINDVVVIGEEDYKKAHLPYGKPEPKKPDNRSVKAIMGDQSNAVDNQDNEEDEVDFSKVTFRAPVEERKGGNSLSAYLAFVPIDIKEITHTRFECYFVNDSNYYIQYSYLAADGNSWTLRAQGEVEPNTKEYIEEFGREELNAFGHVAIQLFAYKREKPFVLKPVVDVQFRIDPVKFYKLHTFQENDFFEQPALLHTIIENDKVTRPLVVDAKQLKAEMYHVEPNDNTKVSSHQNNGYVRRYDDGRKGGNPFITKRKGDEDVIVVDLHANALLDTTAGMSAGDILNYQLDVFRRTLKEHASKKGQRIVFVHGKGEGVLRRALINDLVYRFKHYTYQDASFQEYGYGATQVTIK
jgi:Mismatch repair ATPase (MutS family)